MGRQRLSKWHPISSQRHHIICIPKHANVICLREIMAKVHLLGQLVQTKEGECESLLVDLEGDITFSSVTDKCTISSPNLYTAWEQFCFAFRVQAVVAIIGYDTYASTRIPWSLLAPITVIIAHLFWYLLPICTILALELKVGILTWLGEVCQMTSLLKALPLKDSGTHSMSWEGQLVFYQGWHRLNLLL